MWRTPFTVSREAKPGQSRETSVTSWPAAANACARRCQIFSVDPPRTGGTGRKKPVTMVIVIGSRSCPRRQARQGRDEPLGRLGVSVAGDAPADRGAPAVPGSGIGEFVER